MRREKSGGLALTGLDPFAVQLLREIPEAGADSDPAVQARLHPSPAGGKLQAEVEPDWEEYVRPELRSLFEEARTVVQRDLSRMKAEIVAQPDGPAEPTFRLAIPSRNFDAWLSALNQARLALAARHHFTEADMNDHARFPIASERDLRLFQIDLYGLIQEMIVRRLAGPDLRPAAEPDADL
ncbi:MAG: DUF2017 family protein [Verrucomicrobia bacterium]|nr:DUF2017 family protein [Verrucomicrobiota bacterium]